MSQGGGCQKANPSCRMPQAPRPTCRPAPSLFKRLNCTACNKLFFFVFGAGVAYVWENLRQQAKKAEEEAKKDPKQREKERKEREKAEKAEKDRKEKERKDKEKREKERQEKERKEREKKEK